VLALPILDVIAQTRNSPSGTELMVDRSFISGTVRDSEGAVVARANVTIHRDLPGRPDAVLRIGHNCFNLVAKATLNARGIHGCDYVKIGHAGFHGTIVIQTRGD
jgi:hypothetical protein